MAAVRDLVVHVNDEVVSRHAFELATFLTADLRRRSAERCWASVIALRRAHGSDTTSPSSCDAPLATRLRCSSPMPALRIC